MNFSQQAFKPDLILSRLVWFDLFSLCLQLPGGSRGAAGVSGGQQGAGGRAGSPAESGRASHEGPAVWKPKTQEWGRNTQGNSRKWKWKDLYLHGDTPEHHPRRTPEDVPAASAMRNVSMWPHVSGQRPIIYQEELSLPGHEGCITVGTSFSSCSYIFFRIIVLK